jgi:hypothetical protein
MEIKSALRAAGAAFAIAFAAPAAAHDRGVTVTPRRICPHSQSRLTRDDLCARLAPLDRYGLAELGSALVASVKELVVFF